MEIEGIARPNTKNQESVTLSNEEGNAQKTENNVQNGENQVNGVMIYQTDSEKELIQVKKSENEENQNENENKELNETSCFKKFTSHFAEGTMVNSIFNMSIVSLGTGVFAIPVKVQYMTLVFTPIYVILAGIANLISLFMISYAVDKTGILDFFQITYKILGKICGTILSIVMIVYCYGLVILFQIIVYKLVGGIVNDIGNYNYESLNDFVNNSFWKKYLYKFTICYGINLLLIMPFCLRKNIGEMKISTYVGVISLVFVILIIICQSPFFIDHYYDEIYKKDDKSTHLNVYNLSKGVDKDLNIIRPFVTLFFAYTSQIALFPIISAVKDRTKKKSR